MTPSLRPRDGGEAAELDRSFRSPSQLALAMPLVAVFGLMVVVSAVALGGSAQLVAIVAIGGFGLCAVAPMALIDIFVAKPLRAATARLRAVRDGRAVPEGVPFAAGIVADLVALAEDVRSAQTRFGQYGATLTQCEKMVAAGDEAIRAFRLHTEELAEATALGESQLRRASQSQFSEIAEAVKALRASLPANLDGAVERIESMLVYVGESLDRREAKDKVFEGAFGRVEKSFTELARLVARETEAVQGSLSNAATMLRNDIAASATEDKTARARLVERIETAEARVLTKLFDAAPPEAQKIAETIRAEFETTRRALRDRIEQLVKDAIPAPAPDAEEQRRRIETAAEIVGRASERLAGLAEHVGERLAAVDRLAETTLPATQAALEETTRRLDAIPAPESDEGLRGELRDLAAAVAGLGDALARLEASAAERPTPDIEAPLAALTEASETLTRNLTRLEAVSPGADVEALRADWRATAADLAASLADLGGRLDAASPAAPLDEIVARGVAELAERFGEQTAAQGERIEAVESRVVQQILAVERDAESKTMTALTRVAKQLGAAIDRLDAISAAAGASESAQLQGLRGEIQALIQAVEAAAARQDTSEGLAALSERLDALDAGLSSEGAQAGALRADIAALGEALASLGARVEATAEGQARREALAQLGEQVEAVAARLEASAARGFEDLKAATDRGAEATGLRADMSALADLVGETVASLGARVEATAERQAVAELGEKLEAVAARLDALQTTADRGAEAAGLRADVSALGSLVGEAVASLGARTEAQSERLFARIDDASDAQALARLEQRLESLGAALDASAGALATTAARETAEGLRADLDALADRLIRAVADGSAQTGGEIEGALRAFAENVDGRLGARFDAQAAALAESAGYEATDRATLRAAVAGFAAELRASAEAQARALAARLDTLDRDAFAAPLAAFDAAARRLDQGAEALTEERADVAGIRTEIADLAQRLECRIDARKRDEFDGAVATLQAVIEEVCKTGAQLSAGANALSLVSDAERPALADLRGDVEALAAALGAAAKVADERLLGLEAKLTDGFTALGGGKGGSLDVLAAAAREFAGEVSRLDARLAALPAGADVGEIVQRFDAFAQDQARRAESLEMRLAGRAAANERAALAGALTNSRAMTRALAQAKAQFDETASALREPMPPPAAEAGAALDALVARFEAFASAQNERLLALDLRLSNRAAGIDRTAVASALTVFRTMTRQFAETQERLQSATASIEAQAGREAAAAAEEDTLRAELRGLGAQVADAASRLDAVASDQAERLQALELRLVGKSVSLDRSAVASALTVFRTLTRDLKDATDSLRAATATVADAPAASSAAADLQADLNALGQSFAGALARFDERLDGFAADQADQLVALETRMAGSALALDRTEVASALTVFRDLSRELSDAVGRFGAATGLVEGQAAGKGPQETAAQFGDIAGRLDALASAQGDRLDSLELRLAARDASIDRTAVAGALTAFRALGQSLQEATSRFETATAAVEAKARELLPAPDLAPLAGEIAEIGGRLDAFAASQAEAVAALAARLDGEGGRHYVAVRESEAEAVDALRGELRAVGDQVAQTLGAFAARLDLPPAPRAAESEPPALRDEFDRLGGRLAETLADLERRLTMAGVGRPAAELAAPSATKSPGALAKIVVSLADSLDFRFSQIEQSLAELSTKWQVGDPRRETATTLAEITAVLTQVNSASEVLKTGLSDFIGVSAALMEDVDARHRPQRQEERRDAS